VLAKPDRAGSGNRFSLLIIFFNREYTLAFALIFPKLEARRITGGARSKVNAEREGKEKTLVYPQNITEVHLSKSALRET